MSQGLRVKKLIEDLLATSVSLRVFMIRGIEGVTQYRRTEKYLPYISKTSDRAPHLEYFSERKDYYAKRVCGKWVVCDEAEFPSRMLEFCCT
jgi:hypothetical protein